MSKCGFDIAWVGPCKKTAGESGRCEEHTGLVCVGCGAPAVKSCEHTGIQFVCGASLCGDCRHCPPPEDSLFGMGGGHKPSEIANKEWEAEMAKRR